MRNRTLFAALVAALVVAYQQSAIAVIIASDDFTAVDSGVGWAVGDAWEYLDAPNQRILANNGDTSWRTLDAPEDISNQKTYLRIDYQRESGNSTSWGGLSFFEGTQQTPGREYFFIGLPNQFGRYGASLTVTGTILDSGVARNADVHTMIAEIDTTNRTTGEISYKLWFDGQNFDTPTTELVVTGIADPTFYTQLGAIRIRATGGQADRWLSPLTIATEPSEGGLVPLGDVKVIIDRTTGDISLSNTSVLDGVLGYTLSSAAGAFDATNWTTITGNYDSPPGGDGSVDSDDTWNIVSDLNSNTELSEQAISGDGGSIGTTPVDLGSPWIKTPIEDVKATLLVDVNGTTLPIGIPVEYTGEVKFGDLNGDDLINAADWTQFKSGQGVVDPTMQGVAAYQLGDLNGDGYNLLQDYWLFRTAYDAENGAGAFEAMTNAVPEPSTVALFACAFAGCLLVRRRHAMAVACLMAIGLLAVPRNAQATVFATDNFSAVDSGTGWAVGDSWENLGAGVADTRASSTHGYRAFETPITPFDHQSIYVGFDFQTFTTNNWGGVALFEGPDEANKGDETLFVGRAGVISGYGVDLKGNNGRLNSGVPHDNELHHIIVGINFDDPSGFDTYSIWVDNYDINSPNATTTLDIASSVLQDPWQSLRIAGAIQLTVDNLIVANQDSVAEVFDAPDMLTALVNKSTGEISLVNSSDSNIAINGYSLTTLSQSFATAAADGDYNNDGEVNLADYTVWRNNLGAPEGTLPNDPNSGAIGVDQYNTWHSNFGMTGSGSPWESIASQNLAGFPVGDGSGNGWEEGGSPGSIQVAEYFLKGESTIDIGTTISLGNFYGGGVAGPEDIVFEYVLSDGSIVRGLVEYIGAAGSLNTSTNPVPEPSTLLSLALVGIVVAGTRLVRH